MIFPYWEVHHNGEPRLTPLIPLQVYGPAEAIKVFGLVDSGAEHNVFDEGVAKRLGLPLDQGQQVLVLGVGKGELPGRLLTVDLQVGPHRWTAPTIFSPALHRRAILGQAGFFAFFTVTFRYRRRELEIRRTR